MIILAGDAVWARYSTTQCKHPFLMLTGNSREVALVWLGTKNDTCAAGNFISSHPTGGPLFDQARIQELVELALLDLAKDI